LISRGPENYVDWDTLKLEDVGITAADTTRWGEGGAGNTNITVDKVGSTVTINSSTGTGDSFVLGDDSPTNEIDEMQAFTGDNLVRFIPSYNDLKITGSGGIAVSSSTSSGATDNFTWNIDGSGISSSPWAGSYPDPYVSSGAANVGIGSTSRSQNKLYILENDFSNIPLEIDHNGVSNNPALRINSTRYGDLFQVNSYNSGLSFRL